MRTTARLAFHVITLSQISWLIAAGAAADESARTATNSSRYEYRREHDPNGIAKFYLGREIAHVMGHQAADWLERPEREAEEKPDLLIEALKLKSGDVVADIGAGTGYYSWRMAKDVGEKGVVYAVDIQQEMLDLLAKRMAERQITNVKGVLGTITDPKLPAHSVDLVLMVDVYHEFSEPQTMLRRMHEELKSGGRLVLLEYRKEDPAIPIRIDHKMTVAEAKMEVETEGYKLSKVDEILPRQHILIFTRP